MQSFFYLCYMQISLQRSAGISTTAKEKKVQKKNKTKKYQGKYQGKYQYQSCQFMHNV